MDNIDRAFILIGGLYLSSTALLFASKAYVNFMGGHYALAAGEALIPMVGAIKRRFAACVCGKESFAAGARLESLELSWQKKFRWNNTPRFGRDLHFEARGALNRLPAALQLSGLHWPSQQMKTVIPSSH